VPASGTSPLSKITVRDGRSGQGAPVGPSIKGPARFRVNLAKQRSTPGVSHARRHEHDALLCWRNVFSLCLLALFALQGMVAQGHTHTHSAGADVVVLGDVVIAKTDDQAGSGGAPSAPDSPDCGLCQSLGTGAAPLAVAILFLLLPAAEAGPAPHFVGAPAFTVSAVSYFWTSRGPPLSTPLHA